MIVNRNYKFSTMISLIFISSLSYGQSHTGGVIYRDLNTGQLCAAVKTEYFVDSAATQQNENWCWAACIEMVLDYQGVYLTQSDIVTNIFGFPLDRPADANTIVKAVNAVPELRAYSESPSTKSKYSFVDDLAKKYPLIIGLHMPGQQIGHAYVMTGICFSTNDTGTEVYPHKVILRNPWPKNSNQSEADREELAWNDFINRVHTIVHIYPINN